ncbi:MAG: prenyltransferase/squalene oxidase repeat-containing protein [Streptosporangiaceae bacterium]
MTTTGGDGTAGTWNPAAQLATATTALQRASRLLLARQDSQGWWSGRPEGEISLDAEGLLVREFLGVATPELTKVVAQQVRSLQRTDGSWAGSGEPGRTGARGQIASAANTASVATNARSATIAGATYGASRARGGSGAKTPHPELADPGEPGYASDLSASVLAYLTLRLAGDSPDAYHMAVAAGWIRDAGGVAAATLSAQAWLASFGLTDWNNIAVPLPELIYLPPYRSAALGPWAGWSRPALISLAVTGAVRPVRRLGFNLSALQVPSPSAAASADDWRLRVRRRGLRVPPMSMARAAALRKCGQWIAAWQACDAGQDRISAVWPSSLLALHLLGYPLDHPVLADGLAWLDSVAPRLRAPAPKPHPAGPRRPPVRDTVLAIVALADSGLPGEHPALVAGGQWLLGQRITGVAGRPDPDPVPSGWSFRNDGYPNIADTARALLALDRVRVPGLAGHPAVDRARRWLASMQGRDGGWGGSAAVTALVVQALAVQPPAVPEPAVPEPAVPEPAVPALAGPQAAGGNQVAEPEPGNGCVPSRAVRRGVVFLLRAQRADGSWAAGPGESDTYATATVLPALLAAGVRPGKPVVVKAARWLAGRQNLDAGWPSGPGHLAAQDGRAQSDAPGTARALTALLAARVPELAGPVDLGVDWLVRIQQADGGWSERPAGRSAPRNRGNIVPGLLLPLSALGRYVVAGGSWRERAPATDPVVVDRIAGTERIVGSERVTGAGRVTSADRSAGPERVSGVERMAVADD